MTLTRTITKTKSDASIPWYKFSEEYKQFLTDNNITFTSTEVDALTITTVLEFPDADTKTAWESSPIVINELENLDEFMEVSSITKTVVEE
jgi:hypothetical protein